MQKGQIKQVGNCWLLRYYEPVFENGRSLMGQKTTKLKLDPSAISQKEQQAAARAAADLILARINTGTAEPQSPQGLATFLEHIYFPHVKEKKRAGTYNSHYGMWRLLKDHVNEPELREVRTSDVEDLMTVVRWLSFFSCRFKEWIEARAESIADSVHLGKPL